MANTIEHFTVVINTTVKAGVSFIANHFHPSLKFVSKVEGATTLSITTFSITTFSRMMRSMKLFATFSIMTLIITTLKLTIVCNYAESRHAECCILFIVMLNVVVLSVVMLIVEQWRSARQSPLLFKGELLTLLQMLGQVSML